MTESNAETMKSPENAASSQATSKGSVRFIILSVFVFSLILGFLSHGILGSFGDITEISNPALRRISARIDDIELRVGRIESYSKKVLGQGAIDPNNTNMDNAQNQKTEGSTTPSIQEDKKTSNTEIARLKGDLQGLFTSLSTLQDQLDNSLLVATKNRQAVEAGFSSVVAYMGLQRRALSGRPFEQERQVMQKASADDQILNDFLIQIEPIALVGADQPLTLLKEWKDLAPEIERTLREGRAQTWYERLIVALEGMISIRSLSEKAGSAMVFSNIELDLDRGEVGAALLKVQGLPTTVQPVISEFTIKLKRRVEIEQTLDQIAAHLMTKGRVQEKREEAATTGAPAESAKDSVSQGSGE